ncbi:unnamed protein product [Caenorhabditis nigoni]
MGWVEEWALTDCVVGKIRLIPCTTTCMTVTIQRSENREKLDSIMMDCADDMIYSTPDIPDTRSRYKSRSEPFVFEENARYVAQRDQFAYIKNEKKSGDNNKGLFMVVTMLTIFLMFASCCYCIYYRCRRWCIKKEWEKHRRSPKSTFNENTVEMVDLAVYNMEQGLMDVPKPSGRIRRNDKYKKSATFPADLEEIIEDVEDDFDDDVEPEKCYAPKK